MRMFACPSKLKLHIIRGMFDIIKGQGYHNPVHFYCGCPVAGDCGGIATVPERSDPLSDIIASFIKRNPAICPHLCNDSRASSQTVLTTFPSGAIASSYRDPHLTC